MQEMLYLPSVDEIASEFASEVGALGGQVMSTIIADDRLYARATLPPCGTVRPGDTIHSGVALRAVGAHVSVYPYLFRQICKNGAIQAEGRGSRAITRVATERLVSAAATGVVALAEIRSALRTCVEPAVFAGSMGNLRMATQRGVDTMLQLLHHVSARHVAMHPALLDYLDAAAELFEAGEDHTQYGAMNVVTAMARTMNDPEMRWQLELIGAAVGLQPIDVTRPLVTGRPIVEHCAN